MVLQSAAGSLVDGSIDKKDPLCNIRIILIDLLNHHYTCISTGSCIFVGVRGMSRENIFRSMQELDVKGSCVCKIE